MTKNEDILKLENVVTSLIERFNDLRKEKLELETILSSKNDKIDELSEEIRSLSDEKSNVHGRVSNILGSIEEWEKTLHSEEPEEVDDGEEQLSLNESNEREQNYEPDLFSVGE